MYVCMHMHAGGQRAREGARARARKLRRVGEGQQTQGTGAGCLCTAQGALPPGRRSGPAARGIHLPVGRAAARASLYSGYASLFSLMARQM